MKTDFAGATDPYCKEQRDCFASVIFRGTRKCTVLNETYGHDVECPFCKPKKDVTNGKTYPHNKKYTDK